MNNKKTSSNAPDTIDSLKKEIVDLREKLKAKEQIEKELSIIHDALASSINGVIIADNDGHIQYANTAFIRMFEYKDKDDVINQHVADLFVMNEIKSLYDVEKRIEQEEGETEEFQVHQKDGATFHVEVSTSTIKDQNGKVTGRIAFFVDITERKVTEIDNRRLAARLLNSQEKERQRLSQDLHDSVAQTLHAAQLNFIAYQKDYVKFKDRFKIGLDFIEKVSQELREVCNDLYPSLLKDHGLVSAIKWYSKHYLELNGIKCKLDVTLTSKLTHELEVNIYRIIKEAFSNILKHSRATEVSVVLKEHDEFLWVTIRDNGQGFNVSESPSLVDGFGISNMQQRVKNLGGTIDLVSNEGAGTEIMIKVGLVI